MFDDVNDDYFYYLSPFDSFVCIMGAILTAGIGHFLIPHEPEVFQNEVRQISSDVTRIYIIHSILVCYLIGGLMDGVLDLYPSDLFFLLIGLAILAASVWLSRREPFTHIKI